MSRHNTHTASGLAELQEELRVIRGVLWGVADLARLIERATTENDSTGESETCEQLATKHTGLLELATAATLHADWRAELIEAALVGAISAKGGTP